MGLFECSLKHVLRFFMRFFQHTFDFLTSYIAVIALCNFGWIAVGFALISHRGSLYIEIGVFVDTHFIVKIINSQL